MCNLIATSQFSTFQLVRAHCSDGTSRNGRIAQIIVNDLGTVVYILQDGGRFGATEIEPVR